MAATDTNTSGTTVNGDSERGGKVISKVRESAAAQLSTQKNKATEGIGTVAQAVRQSTQQLRDQHHETLAGYVESAAAQVERFSQRLRDKDVGELLEDAQRFARKQPAVFIGSAFVAGLLGVRFLKSSARDDRERGGRFSRSGAGREHGSTVTSYTPRQQTSAAGRAGGASASDTPTGGYAAGASGTEVVSGASGPERTSTEASDKRNAGTGGSRPGGSASGGRTPRSGKEKT